MSGSRLVSAAIEALNGVGSYLFSGHGSASDVTRASSPFDQDNQQKMKPIRLIKLSYTPSQETLLREHKRLLNTAEAYLDHIKMNFPQDFDMAEKKRRLSQTLRVEGIDDESTGDSLVVATEENAQESALQSKNSIKNRKRRNRDREEDQIVTKTGESTRIAKDSLQSLTMPVVASSETERSSSSSSLPITEIKYELSKNAQKIKPILQDDVSRNELNSDECESVDGEDDIPEPPLLMLGEKHLPKKSWKGWAAVGVDETEAERIAELPIPLRVSEGCIVGCACCKLIYEKTWSHPVNQLKLKLLRRAFSFGEIDLDESDPESVSAFTGVPIDVLRTLTSFPAITQTAISMRLLDALHERKLVSRLHWTRGVVYVLVCAEWERRDKEFLKQSASIAATLNSSSNSYNKGRPESRSFMKAAVARAAKRPQKRFRIVLIDVSSIAIMALPEEIASNEESSSASEETSSPLSFSETFPEASGGGSISPRSLKRLQIKVKSKLKPDIFKIEHAHEYLIKIGYQAPYYQSEDDEKGRCVYTQAYFPKGTFFCQYIGQLITQEEAEDREDLYADASAGCYSYYFKPRNTLLERHCVDSTAERAEYGIGRLLNHSRSSPNISTETIFFDGITHIMFIAKKDVFFGDELKFDYGERDNDVLATFTWMRK